MNQSEESRIRRCIKQQEENNTPTGKMIAQYTKRTRELNKLFQEREPIAIRGKELQAAFSKLKQKKSLALFYLHLAQQNLEKNESEPSVTQTSLKSKLEQLTAQMERKKQEIQEREKTIQSYTKLLQRINSDAKANALK